MNLKSKEEITDVAKGIIAKALGIDVAEISMTEEFVQLGMDSLQSMFVLDDLEKKLDMQINPLLFWEHPTLGSLVDELYELQKKNPA